MGGALDMSTRDLRRTVQIEARPLASALGTEFLNIDLCEEQSDMVVAAIRSAFYDTGLVLIRGQKNLTFAQQRRFASYVGTPVNRMPKGFQGLVAASDTEQYISNTRPEGYGREGRLLKHSDFCFDQDLLLGLSLFGEVPPTRGGATIFVNAKRGADQLNSALRAQLESATVRHVYDFDGVEDGHTKYDINGKPHVASYVRPALLEHPVTGETILYVNELMTDRVEGLSQDDSRALLEDVYEHLDDPSLRYDHTWIEGDVIIFDNIKLQHGRTDMPKSERRSLRRLQIDIESAPSHE
jgi:taurine dioxygenase